jgi:hypothetical protein
LIGVKLSMALERSSLALWRLKARNGALGLAA